MKLDINRYFVIILVLLAAPLIVKAQLFGGQIKANNRGIIFGLNCASATNNGTLIGNTPSSGVSSIVPYSGGNGGSHNGQIVSSTGVTGLTATLAAGTFANGAGGLTYSITGTPSAAGTANFALNLGGQSCTLNLSVVTLISQYPAGSVFCNGPTAIVEITNPLTGKTWMDRNLGASRVATSSNDANAYGDLYQWGRRSDGHQCRNSPTTSTLSSTDQPVHGNFILGDPSFADWRSPQNDNLWQGNTGVNKPCPSGFRIPSRAELDAEALSWNTQNTVGAFSSPLKLSLTGRRLPDGSLDNVGIVGCYWSSTVIGAVAYRLEFLINIGGSYYINRYRAQGSSVRCIKN
jgi:hypothetical protein